MKLLLLSSSDQGSESNQSDTPLLYRVHFKHQRVAERYDDKHLSSYHVNPHRWYAITTCTLHAQECPTSSRPCLAQNGVTKVSKCSTLDQFDRHKGLKLSFQRAVEA